jgi:hypothetical protein
MSNWRATGVQKIAESPPQAALEAACRAAAEAIFDDIGGAWHDKSERQAFIDCTWKPITPQTRAAIAAYLRAKADDCPGPEYARMFRLMAAELHG